MMKLWAEVGGFKPKRLILERTRTIKAFAEDGASYVQRLYIAN